MIIKHIFRLPLRFSNPKITRIITNISDSFRNICIGISSEQAIKLHLGWMLNLCVGRPESKYRGHLPMYSPSTLLKISI